MTRRVRVLPPEVIDGIAAGEVVERPASIVKELVENSLDAGSGWIRISADRGGVALVEVADDGCGMGPEDAVEALKRHATSKIRGLDELMALESLGFRGEALSSIAAVSRLELVTREPGALEGTRVVAEEGRVLEAGPWGAPPGTRVRVEALFRNVPARRKFLRTEATEAHRIREVVERIALMHWGVGFQYHYGGRALVACAGASSWPERVRQVLGPAVFENLHAVHRRDDDPVMGYLSHPNFHRPTASGLLLYVNRRPVQDRGLLGAVMRGYGALLERGRYPVGLLHLVLDPSEVDVNVHPTKREVRFRDPRAVQDQVSGMVRRLLREQPWVPDLGDPEGRGGMAGSEEPREGHRVAEPPRYFRLPLQVPAARVPSPAPSLTAGEESEVEAVGVRYLGQVGATFLVFAAPDGLILVDQHAAHERILYERLRDEMERTGEGAAQGLLWEDVVEVEPGHGKVLDRLRGILERVGFVVEPFGGGTWRIRQIPPWLEPGRARTLLHDLIGAEGHEGWGAEAEGLRERLLARMACHGAVKGSCAVTPTEAVALLSRMRETSARGLCPHGRPTLVEIRLAEIRRRFSRT